MDGKHGCSCKSNAHKLRIAVAELGDSDKSTPRLGRVRGYAMGGEGNAIEK